MPTSTRDARQAVPDSFIHAARREQLVRAAIDAIAEWGVADASVVKIAKRAGVSRGVIAYHFRDIDDLIDAVVAEVYRLGGERLGARVASAGDPREALQTFVAGSVEFYAEFPGHLAALHEIFVVRRRLRTREASTQHRRELDDVAQLLIAGQTQGQFRPFDVETMADIIRAVLDTAVDALVRKDLS